MQTTSIQNRVHAADLPLEMLAGNAKLSEQEKVGELGRQFEAVLLRRILNEAQKTQFPSKYHNDSFASGVYQDMIANQLADGMSKSGTVGLGRQLAQQLTRQGLSTSSATKP
jgi:Rod binding domain-containing protein